MEQTVPKMLKDSAGKWPEIPAQYFKNAAGTFSFFTYKELLEKVLDFGAGLLSLGIKREENVGLISDNHQMLRANDYSCRLYRAFLRQWHSSSP